MIRFKSNDEWMDDAMKRGQRVCLSVKTLGLIEKSGLQHQFEKKMQIVKFVRICVKKICDIDVRKFCENI
jgi:hypothetical protein